MSRKSAIAGWDALIARVAGRQHGVITTEQLLDIGLSNTTITAYVTAGRLHRIHRGVYAVGHKGLSLPGTWMAAVLACGPEALLSQRSAAYLWKMLKPIPGPVHVTVPSLAGRRKRHGITIHRSSTLLPSQSTLKANIPVTSPTRTLEDLHRTVPPHEYRQALRQAEYDRLPLSLPTDGTRSELETLFLKLLRRHRLPLPEVYVRLGPFLIDFLWRGERLAVELDGYAAHSGQAAFEDDRARDAELVRRGYSVLRFTWRQVTQEPRVIAGTIRALLHA